MINSTLMCLEANHHGSDTRKAGSHKRKKKKECHKIKTQF